MILFLKKLKKKIETGENQNPGKSENKRKDKKRENRKPRSTVVLFTFWGSTHVLFTFRVLFTFGKHSCAFLLSSSTTVLHTETQLCFHFTVKHTCTFHMVCFRQEKLKTKFLFEET